MNIAKKTWMLLDMLEHAGAVKTKKATVGGKAIRAVSYVNNIALDEIIESGFMITKREEVVGKVPKKDETLLSGKAKLKAALRKKKEEEQKWG